VKNILCIFVSVLSLVGLWNSAAEAAPGKFNIDPTHSTVRFEINHLVIATVEGRFGKFEGSYTFDREKKSASDVNVRIQTASIDTNEPDRDKHLRSADFFDAEKYPEITFTDAKIVFNGGKPTQATGKLKIKNVTKEIPLTVNYKGETTDPWGNEKVVFDLDGKLDRRDFGLTWNKKLDKGGFVVGDQVTVKIRIESNLEKPSAEKTKTAEKKS
jgi:polyisoprenoid-binding protein YceI